MTNARFLMILIFLCGLISKDGTQSINKLYKELLLPKIKIKIGNYKNHWSLYHIHRHSIFLGS